MFYIIILVLFFLLYCEYFCKSRFVVINKAQYFLRLVKYKYLEHCTRVGDRSLNLVHQLVIEKEALGMPSPVGREGGGERREERRRGWMGEGEEGGRVEELGCLRADRGDEDMST